MLKPVVETYASFPFVYTRTIYLPHPKQSWKEFSAEVKELVGDVDKEVYRHEGVICLRVTEAKKDVAFFQKKEEKYDDLFGPKEKKCRK